MDARLLTPAGCSSILPQETAGHLQAELKMKTHLSGVRQVKSLGSCCSFCMRGTRVMAGSSML